jgi:toxin HigB-1
VDIVFKSKKLEKTLNSEKEIYRKYGKEIGRLVMRRLQFLSSAPTLADVPQKPPERCHELRGERKGEFAVDLKHPYRLIFRPYHDPVPRKDDGGVDLNKITIIEIITIEDYH